jgi:hypothetical protein
MNLDYVTNVVFLSQITTILSPMVLVRNQIRNMVNGERGKIALRRITYTFRISSNKNTSMVPYIGTLGGCRWYHILVHWEGAELEHVFVKFMTVFVVRRDAACS